MGYKRVENLGDVARYGLQLKVVCLNCGRTRYLHASALYRRFSASTRLSTIGRHLVCQGTDLEEVGCGHKGALVDFVIPDPPAPPDDGGGGKVVSIMSRIEGSGAFYDHAKRRRRA